MRFYETKMGCAFFEHQVPQLITAVEKLAAALSRPVLSVTVPEADPKFLHDLFFGKYEPEVYQVTPEIQQLGRAVSMSAPTRFCSFSANRKCRKMAGKDVQPLNNYTRRFRPSSLKQADKSGLDGLQTGK